MPQIKGAGSWLTNVRQDMPDKRCGIDNSGAKIENEYLTQDMRRELDSIHLQAHRAMADRQFDIKQTQGEVQNYTRMRTLAKDSLVDRVMETRRKDAETAYNTLVNTPQHGGRATTSSGARGAPAHLLQAAGGRPQTSSAEASLRASATNPRPMSRPKPGPPPATGGFSAVRVNDEEEEEYVSYQRYQRTPRATGAQAPPSSPGMPRRRPRGRPGTSHTQGRSIRQIRQALADEFSSAKQEKKRPNTHLGFTRGDEGGEEEEEDEGSDTYDPFKGHRAPGRSIQQLKKLTHIDKLNAKEVSAWREFVQKNRQERIKLENMEIQERLHTFYRKLDDFKQRSQRAPSAVKWV